VAKASEAKGASANTAAATIASIPSTFDVAYAAVKAANPAYANVTTVEAASASSVTSTGGCSAECQQNVVAPSTGGPAFLWQGMAPVTVLDTQASTSAFWSQFGINSFAQKPVGVPTPAGETISGEGSQNTLWTPKTFPYSGVEGTAMVYFKYGPGWNPFPLNAPEINLDADMNAGGEANDHSSTNSPACQDYDSDGDVDCLIGRADGSLVYWENNGTTPFGTGVADLISDNQAPLTPYGGQLDDSTGACTAPSQFCAPWKTPGLGDWTGAKRNTTTLNSIGVGGCDVVAECVQTLWACCGGFVANQTFARPTAVDIDNDGDFDIFVGGGFGKLRFLQNVGTKHKPEWRLNVTHNPLQDVDVGWLSAPTFADFDGDGAIDCLIGQDKGPAGTAFSITAKIKINQTKLTQMQRQQQGFPKDPGSEASSGKEGKFFREAWLDDDGKLWTDPGAGYKADLIYYKNTGSKTNPEFSLRTGSGNNPMHGVQGRIPSCIDIDGDGDIE